MKQKFYDAERDTDGYENTVMKHMLAMTTEGLHSKSAIAVELAYRDKLLADSKQRIAELEKDIEIYATNFEAKARQAKELEQSNERLTANIDLLVSEIHDKKQCISELELKKEKLFKFNRSLTDMLVKHGLSFRTTQADVDARELISVEHELAAPAEYIVWKTGPKNGIYITAEDVKHFAFMAGIDSGNDEDDVCDMVLWVGEITDEDTGIKTFGINYYNTEVPEGSDSFAVLNRNEFNQPTISPAIVERIKALKPSFHHAHHVSGFNDCIRSVLKILGAGE